MRLPTSRIKRFRIAAGFTSLLLPLLLAPASKGEPAPVQYETTRPDVTYVGSKACSGCHQQIYSTHFTTAMGRSMGPANDPVHLRLGPPPVTVKHPRLNRHYQVYRSGDQLFQAEYELDPSGKEVFRTTHPLDYAVGSGARGITYIVRRGNHLFQAPLSYYAGKGTWELSPGYESDDWGFNRQIETSCLACHAGRPKPVANKPGFFEDPPFEELAIGCETCHGPGEAHLNARLKKLEVSGEVDRTIFDPSKAPPRLGENVCMGCHQWGDARTLQSGKTYFDFRPGAYLYDTLAILKAPPEPAANESVLLEHHFGMQMSRCFQASEGKLSCFSCHEVHRPPKPSAKSAYYRGKCLSCHTDQSCGVPLAERQARQPANDCAACHMPRRDLEGIRHTALTNHRISLDPGNVPYDELVHLQTPGLPDLLLLNPPEGEKIELPLATRLRAFAEMASEKPDFAAKSSQLLDQLAAGNPDDPFVLAGLGRRAKQEKTPDGDRRAIEYLSKAVELNSPLDSVYYDLAEILNRAGRGEEALAVVDKGIAQAPFSRTLSRMRTFTLLKLERYEEAEKTIRRHVELFPSDAELRELLRKIDAANAGL